MCGAPSPTSGPYPPLQLGRQDPSKSRWTTSRPLRSSRVFAKRLPHTRLYLDLASLGAWRDQRTKSRFSQTKTGCDSRSLTHGTPDAAFIYPLAQDANAQVPLAVGLSVRHYSELSDAEHVFYAGDSCLKVALRATRRAAVNSDSRKEQNHAKLNPQ
jgi:hypothetical protein